MSPRSSYQTALTTSAMWVVRFTCGLVRCARSPMPVRLGVKTSWPASRSGPRTLRKPCAPPHAPCTRTKTVICTHLPVSADTPRASSVTLTGRRSGPLAQPNDLDIRCAIYSRLVGKKRYMLTAQSPPGLQLSTWSSLVLYHLGVPLPRRGASQAYSDL